MRKFLFGTLAGWIGAKRSILLSLVVYAGITLLARAMTTATHSGRILRRLSIIAAQTLPPIPGSLRAACHAFRWPHEQHGQIAVMQETIGDTAKRQPPDARLTMY